MNKIYKPILLALFGGLAAYGCGSSGSSSMEMPGNNNQNNVLNGVTLMSSKQGQSVGLVDADGDTIPDKVVGAPYAVTSTNTGAVLVYKGDSAGGFSLSPSNLLTGDDNLGFSFAKLQKGSSTNPDNIEMFAVGAINGSGDGQIDASLCGTVSIYKSGSDGPQLVTKLSGDGAMAKFGLSLAAGDMNDDGYTDIAVGAPFNTNAPSLYMQGAVYVYLGPDFSATTRKTLYASTTNKGLGWAVATGDINGDGKSDLLISATGKLLGYYGGTSFAPVIGSPDVAISSTAAGFGKAIAVIGDIDADTYGEIAIGAPNAVINNNRDTGSVHIIKGGTGNRTISNADTSADKIVRIDGNALFDRLGASIVSVGDVDGDGKQDFAVSATMADVNTGDISGKVYLFKGKDISSTTTLANATAFNGTIKDQAYGTFLAPAGNGKLLIGAPASNMNTGGVSMVDLATGQLVPGGSSGGSAGDGGDCHAPKFETDTEG